LNLWRWGAAFVRSDCVFKLATLLLSAICTPDSWRKSCVDLVGLASCDSAVLPFERAWRRQHWGHHWDSLPPAFVLQDAVANFLSMPGNLNEVSVAVVTPEVLENVRAFSASLPASVALQLLHTWANGWTTSFWMRETQLLNCIFGCVGEPDTQQHYLICPCFWGVINCVLGPCPAEGFLSHLCFLLRVWS